MVHFHWYEGLSGDTSKPVGLDSPEFTSPHLVASTPYWVRATNAQGEGGNSPETTVEVLPAEGVRLSLTHTAASYTQYWDPSSWPKSMHGVGLMEAPRGGLSHWIVIESGKIDNYQAIVPSTWNAGPRDTAGNSGPYEASLQHNHVLADPKQPLEILRTIHSYDPCIACAVHVTDPEGDELVQVKVK